MMIGIFAILLFTLVDTFFIGLLGDAPLVATGFILPVTFMVMSLAMGMGVGISAVLGRLLGAGDRHLAARFTTDSLILSVILVALISTLGFFTIDPLFTLMGASPEVLGFIRGYMSIWFLGVTFLVIPMVGNAAIRSTGDIKSPTIVMLVAGIVNGIFDPLLIFGLGPFPEMGVEGAALATVISWVITFIVAIKVLYQREKLLLINKPKLAELIKNWRKILSISIPASIAQMLNPLANMVVVAILATTTPLAVAAFSVGSRFEGLLLVPLMAFSALLPTIMGQNFGAKLFDRAKQSLLVSVHLNLLVQISLFIIVLISAPWLVMPFSKNPEVQKLATFYLQVVTLSYGFMGISMILSQALNVLHRPIQSLAFNAARLFLLLIPASFFGALVFNAKGVFIAISFINVITGFAAYWYIRRLARNLEHYQ